MVFEIGYVTDIEGNLAYFERWITQSRILRYTADGVQLEFVHDNAYFVYGGVGSHTHPFGVRGSPRDCRNLMWLHAARRRRRDRPRQRRGAAYTATRRPEAPLPASSSPHRRQSVRRLHAKLVWMCAR
eukprot:5190926-Prymnesium_polylepis.2